MISSELATIKKMIYQHCGLLLEGIAEERLRKAVQANMEEKKCASLAAYYQLLNKDAKAFDQLVNQMTVNETYFFREPEQIRLLVDYLLPQLLANKPSAEPLRLLSAGCSSGEEPYSLAIAVRESLGVNAAKHLKIDAGDLDHNILKKAESGVYSDFSFRGVDPELRKRYFLPKGRGYQLIPAIRQQVSFYELNLLAEHLPKQLNNYDIIFFRNVSIYFDLETRLVIQKKLYDLMKDDGVLILGSSETLGNNLGVFELAEQHNQYYFVKGRCYLPDKKITQVKPEIKSSPTTYTVKPESDQASQPASNAVELFLPDIKTIQQLLLGRENQRALQLLNHLLSNDQNNQPARLLKIWILLNNKDFIVADALLDAAFKVDAWSVDVLLMKGLSAKWQKQSDLAIQWFKKVVYISPECWSAHYYLADTYRNDQQLEAASKSYQMVLRILKNNPDASDSIQWVPLSLPAGDVLFLSQRHLQNLTAGLQMRDK